jgi:hypothetical protein
LQQHLSVLKISQCSSDVYIAHTLGRVGVLVDANDAGMRPALLVKDQKIGTIARQQDSAGLARQRQDHRVGSAAAIQIPNAEQVVAPIAKKLDEALDA